MSFHTCIILLYLRKLPLSCPAKIGGLAEFITSKTLYNTCNPSQRDYPNLILPVPYRFSYPPLITGITTTMKE